MRRMGRLLLFVIGWLQAIWVSPGVHAACFPAIFNFGDGSSDTGGIHAAFPTLTAYDSFPYGTTFFQRVSHRASNGRLVIDFLADALGLQELSPYLQSVSSDFSTGVNFATAGSTALPVSTGQTAGPNVWLSPFGLNMQILQYQEFQANVLDVIASDARAANSSSTLSTSKSLLETSDEAMPKPEPVNATSLAEEAPSTRLPLATYFGSGLYILSIGTSDITNSWNLNLTIDQVQAKYPLIISAITGAVRSMYFGGARYLIVVDVEPLGCQPFVLSRISHTAHDLDVKGCLIAYNAATQVFNSQLKTAVEGLRTTYSALNVYFLSQYDMKINLLKNLTLNGFDPSVTSTACCGIAGSPQNVNLAIGCRTNVVVNNLTMSATVCEDPSKYIYWDGVYNSEAANKYIANQILSGSYFDRAFPDLTTTCGLHSFT